MSFKRVIFLILAVFAVYHAFVTPLPADSDVSYRMGALTANVLLPVLLLYFAFKKEKPKNEKLKKEKDNEKGYEKFIENFLDIKIFKLFGKNITLYSKKDVENSNILKRIIKLMTYRLKNEFNVINNLMYIFDMKSSKDSIALKLYGCLYVGVLIFGYILYLFLNEIMIMWILFVFFIISEYINVLLKEKNFEWNKNNESSFLMFFFITVIYVYAMFFKFELIYQYMILNLVIFFKIIAISRLRYKRLKNFSKKVLDVFVLKK